MPHMARSLWSGAISFGLVNVPVKLYSAVSQKEVHFNMLHEKDGGRIRQKRVCSVDGEEVPWEEIAKGFEVKRGRYVMLAKEELEALEPKATRAIEIEDFVDLGQIDPVYYDHTYYAAPDEGAERPYGLLVEAMRRTNKIAIGRLVLRTKGYLCAIRPMEDGLAISTMQYADEIVPMESLGLPKKGRKPSDRELGMAEKLVESLTSDFEPDKYKDEHRERVLELLKRKEEGEEIVAPPEEEERPRVINLADALERSLSAARGRGARGSFTAEAHHEARDRGERKGREERAEKPASRRRTARKARKRARRTSGRRRGGRR